MVNFNDELFGKPINLNNSNGSLGANAMISQFLKVKNTYKTKIHDLVGEDTNARRYYCEDDCAYIFSVEIMKSLVKAIECSDSGKGCVILFQGIRKCNGAEQNNFIFGRPTVIATAYEYSGDKLKHIQVDNVVPLKNNTNFQDKVDGYEHPGDGKSKNKDVNINSLLSDLTSPVVKRSDSEDSDVEYEIITPITDSDLKDGWTNL